MTPRLAWCAAAAVSILAGSAGMASGQDFQQGRPHNGLFGGEQSGTPRNKRSLALTTSVLQAYDDDVLADLAGVGGSPAPVSGMFTGVRGFLDYAQRSPRVTLTAGVNGSLRYYQYDSNYLSVSHQEAVGLTANFARQTNLSISQSVGYMPTHYFLQRLLSATGVSPNVAETLSGTSPVGLGFESNDTRVWTYETTGMLTHGFTRRATLTMSGNYRRTDLGSNPNTLLSDFLAYDVGAQFRYGVSRNAGLRAGYRYRKGEHAYTATGSDLAIHDVNLGVDYGRGLSLTRRTTLAFNVGSSLVRSPYNAFQLRDPSENQLGDANQNTALQYLVLGDVVLIHGMGRTWNLGVTYNRQLGLVEGMTAPIFSDSLAVSLRGLLNRRVQFGATASYSLGDALTNSAPQFRTYTAATQMVIALNRTWAFNLDYVYHYYDFDEADQLVWDIPRRLGRNSIQAGVAMRFPLIGR